MVRRRQRDHRVLPMEGAVAVPVLEKPVDAPVKDRVGASGEKVAAIPVRERLPVVPVCRA